MNRALAAVVVALAVLAGCGTGTCTSEAARLDPNLSSPSCTLRAGTSATIQVPLCSRCNDSLPDCQAEFLGNRVEVAPVVQQCVDESGCAAAGCNPTARLATCTVTTPAASGNYQLVVVGASASGSTVTVPGTLTVSASGSTSCGL